MTLQTAFRPNLLSLAALVMLLGGCVHTDTDSRILALDERINELQIQISSLIASEKVLARASTDNSHAITQNSESIITLARKMK